MIASGLRAFYGLGEMQGRRVMVLANLKGRNMAGFKSEGMVSQPILLLGTKQKTPSVTSPILFEQLVHRCVINTYLEVCVYVGLKQRLSTM